jgi:hypothetical protein
MGYTGDEFVAAIVARLHFKPPNSADGRHPGEARHSSQGNRGPAIAATGRHYERHSKSFQTLT